MVLPILAPLAIVGATGASIAFPHFFPTEAEKATVELNKKLTGVTLPPNGDSKVSPDKKKGFSFDLSDKKTQTMIIFAVVAVIILFVVLR